MKRLFIILINMLLAYTAMAQQNIATVRNGQGLTEYVYPLNGDIESIECISVQTNPDTGKEYSTVSSTISFNENGDVTCVSPYEDLRYSDVVLPAVLCFIYDDSGKNTKIIEEVYWDDKIAYCNEIVYTYNDKQLPLSRIEYVGSSSEELSKQSETRWTYDTYGTVRSADTRA